MDDRDVLAQIGELVAEEHRLERRHAGEGLDAHEADQLRRLEFPFARCWTLPQRCRPPPAAGLDPEGAGVRPESTVEG
jgi:uncharacterized protein DUF2630